MKLSRWNRAHHLLLTPDMKQNRQPVFLDDGPQRLKPDVARRMMWRVDRWYDDCLSSRFDGLECELGRPIDVDQRDVSCGEQPAVNRAKVGHHPVVCPRDRDAQLVGGARLQAVVAQRLRCEHQQAGEAQQVEQLWPIVTPERTERQGDRSEWRAKRARPQRSVGIARAEIPWDGGRQAGRLGR